MIGQAEELVGLWMIGQAEELVGLWMIRGTNRSDLSQASDLQQLPLSPSRLPHCWSRGFSGAVFSTSCLQIVERKAKKGPQQPTSRQPVTALKPASLAVSKPLTLHP
ncbi:hypothetical protein [Paenibacillus sp. Soil787]|uniref:hypothetical protein n=1 Tax=Paenibacillus sp. Soil787 TaxID=1736411 RepID=UPI0006FFD730|nr:hypothetical protein [Paenibacillus sp. Soil787]KRF38592.1 hypothetical protein ASG93_24245 [Paenibacillus sp. Soil787]